jgi:RNase H
MRSTPTAALETLLMLPPLNIFIEKEARQVMYRLKCLGRLKNSRTGNSLIYDKMVKESPIIAVKTHITTHTNVFDRRFIVKLPPRKLWMNQAENMTSSDICEPDTLKLEESFSLGTYTAVFQAGVYAILACSDICLKSIHILSDSKADLMALSSYKISSSIVMQCWSSLQALSTSNRVRMSWVPGHCDIAGNEMADKLVRGGSAAIFCGLKPTLPLSGSIIQLMTKKWAENAL